MSTIAPLPPVPLTGSQDRVDGKASDAELRESAKQFEAAFISQMLKHSGLPKALTGAGGQGAEAFTGFYLDQLAEQIAEGGGLGLAEQIYRQLADYQNGE